MKRMRHIAILLFAAVCIFSWSRLAGKGRINGTATIRSAMKGGNTAMAGQMVDQDLDLLLAQKAYDSLLGYVMLKGQLTQRLHGKAAAKKALEAFARRLKQSQVPDTTMILCYRRMADFHEEEGDYNNCYEIYLQALHLATALNDSAEIASCEYNLGVYANHLGNVALSGRHHHTAMNLRERISATRPEDLYFSCNAMGAIMWYASQYDSANYYYNRALDALKKMPDNDLNTAYRPAIILNNIAALYSAEGKTTEAINAMNESIARYRQFLSAAPQHPKASSAREGIYEAVENLAGIYKEVGDYKRAGELLRYALQQKKAHLPKDHPAIFFSEILLGDHFNSISKYDSARSYLLSGLQKLEAAQGDFLYWAADGYYNLALVYENLQDSSRARRAWLKAEQYFDASYQGSYDNVYLDFLRQDALFKARHGDYAKAQSMSYALLDYLKKSGVEESLQQFYQLINLSEISYVAGQYETAEAQSAEAIALIEKMVHEAATLLDSVKMEVLKPRALLMGAKSAYALKKNHDAAFLESLSRKLNLALSIVEQRKMLLDDPSDLNILLSEHKELIDFAAQLALEHYRQSLSSASLERFLNLKESEVFSRLRSRLEQQQAIQFSGVPPSVVAQEFFLKAEMKKALEAKVSEPDFLKRYQNVQALWLSYLDILKANYPRYYQLRFATLFQPVAGMYRRLPENTTLVRYYFVDTGLVAFVAHHDTGRLVRLSVPTLQKDIQHFLDQDLSEAATTAMLHRLYLQLWQPLKPFVTTQQVTVIPDGTLYHINLEMLPARPVRDFAGLAKACLLQHHTFSYCYSLLALGQHHPSENFARNYIAFAPGFSDDLKSVYVQAIKDSMNIDEGYLHLLPQPGTRSLTKKLGALLDGDVYSDEHSTRTAFLKHAGSHKLLHIATHALFDDIRPEQSGLVFSKEAGAETDNRVMTRDIFNCNLNSDVTLLTACESGRPGYQDGEGLISLSHAFSYAGSQNIVTALWKVDEQASAAIVENFVELLRMGLPTDAALREAKLRYLRNARGRLVNPGYWAGLVLIGRPQTVHFEPTHRERWLWLAGGLLILLTVIIFIGRKKSA